MVHSEYIGCRLCPRLCGADRTQNMGRCGGRAEALVAAASLHKWEEPCLSGKNGAGAVFFSGCPLGCVFCQNREISIERKGESVSASQLARIFTELEAAGAECLDLVSATQYAPTVFEALDIAKPKIPVVWNTGGYERAELMDTLLSHIDVYLPDFKFFSPELSKKLCGAPDYAKHAIGSLKIAVDTLGECVFDERGMLKRGTVVRHLVLPGQKNDSIEILKLLKNEIDITKIKLSLMSQFTPFFPEKLPKGMNRKITSYEYSCVLEAAAEMGFDGFCQDRSSAERGYLPSFDLKALGGDIKEF